MHSLTASDTSSPRQGSSPFLPSRFLLLVAPACFLLGMVAAGSRSVSARQATEAEAPTFLKLGRNYVNLQRISHVIDEPGQNLPPGTITIYFGGGMQSWLSLFEGEAEAFRQALAKVSTDLSPKESMAARKSSAGARKSPFLKKPAPVEGKSLD
ncbi:MAG: hypothetical protein NVSMB9_20370 [Isosphaeraceae bacterium]